MSTINCGAHAAVLLLRQMSVKNKSYLKVTFFISLLHYLEGSRETAFKKLSSKSKEQKLRSWPFVWMTGSFTSHDGSGYLLSDLKIRSIFNNQCFIYCCFIFLQTMEGNISHVLSPCCHPVKVRGQTLIQTQTAS